MTPAEKYEYDRRNNLKRYGITPEQYQERYQAQEGRCAICSDSHEVLHVDHDHGTGEIRGLLCNNCNRFIGLAGDSPQTLLSAAEYLSQ